MNKLVLMFKTVYESVSQLPDTFKVISTTYIGLAAYTLSKILQSYNILIDIFAGVLTICSTIFVIIKIIDLTRDMKHKKSQRRKDAKK